MTSGLRCIFGSMIAKHIIVHGRVQGVGYRYHTLLSAQKNTISGWVQNNEDGTVEIMALGTKSDMEAFLLNCKTGPNHGRVDKMDVAEAAVSTFTSFKIIR